ncbi:MAG TPA: hypothetical protein PKC22_10355, partial [Rhodocyclaceae bacterium]|nr:hypothetical protein [Rhodocyclaceae bacterium]
TEIMINGPAGLFVERGNVAKIVLLRQLRSDRACALPSAKSKVCPCHLRRYVNDPTDSLG